MVGDKADTYMLPKQVVEWFEYEKNTDIVVSEKLGMKQTLKAFYLSGWR